MAQALRLSMTNPAPRDIQCNVSARIMHDASHILVAYAKLCLLLPHTVPDITFALAFRHPMGGSKIMAHVCEYRSLILWRLSIGAGASEESSLFLEPMQWMYASIVGETQGKLYCPGCEARLGSFNWSGIRNTRCGAEGSGRGALMCGMKGMDSAEPPGAKQCLVCGSLYLYI